MAYTTINKSSSFQNQVLYTGNGSTQSVTGVGFQPDFTWCKQRNTSRNHGLFDAVRGVTKILYSNDNATQGTAATSLTSFNSDGFSCGGETETNQNGGTYVAWNWKAGGGQGSSNTDGSINTTYTSVNTTSGFSISSYTGTGSNATVGHGLGAVPKMIIVKETTGSPNDWTVYHATQGNTTRGILNETNAWGSNTAWNNTTPTSSLFYIGSGSNTNRSGSTYTAYCFAEKQGYSKFGSYVGNGNSDGPFNYCGFKPEFVMIKLSSAADDWQIFDTKRNTFNIMDKYLRPNNVGGTVTNAVIDFVSNGFKLRSSAGSFNPSGGTAIYMAFGQTLVGTNNIPNNAF